MSVVEVRAASVANDRVISKLRKQLHDIQREELQLSIDVCELSQVLQEEVKVASVIFHIFYLGW